MHDMVGVPAIHNKGIPTILNDPSNIRRGKIFTKRCTLLSRKVFLTEEEYA